MVTIYIDNRAYRVQAGQNLLQACLSLKMDLPYFCWHPAMGSVGACRQCAMTQYADENDERGRLIVACMTPVAEGMRVSLTGQNESQFREQIIGALMTNHPHDCPVCTEGGECHLQDMTVMTGHHGREFEGLKRTHQSQYLGPLVNHEMNRCIACYRCERFYRDYAGGKDLAAQGSKNHVFFGRQEDGVLESEFAGNLCEVCPTGVFTDKPFGEHFSRKWDLNSTPSICPHCSVGCNLSYSERYGSLRRAVNRYHDEINGYFICDRGRYGHGFANSERRLNQLYTFGEPTGAEFSHPKIRQNLIEARTQPLYGIGDADSSLESQYAFKSLVDDDKYCPGLTESELSLLRLHKKLLQRVAAPSVTQIERADVILILNEDIATTAPRIALAVRQAIKNKGREQASALGIPAWQDSAIQLLARNEKTPLYVIANGTTGLDELTCDRVLVKQQQVAPYIARLVTKFNRDAPTPSADALASTPEQEAQLEKIHTALKSLKRPLIITGWQQAQVADLQISANLYKALDNPDAMLCIVPNSANSLALAPLIDEQTLSLEQITGAIIESPTPSSLLLGDMDLYSKLDAEDVIQCLKAPELVLQLATLKNRCTELSHLTLPCANFTEQSGHLINYEGRVQPFYAVTQVSGKSQPSWFWLGHLAEARHPQNAARGRIALDLVSLQREMLHKLELPEALLPSPSFTKTARGTKRSSGRTAMHANQTVHEPKPTQDNASPFSFTMEGKLSGSENSASDMPYSWSPGWNSNQSVHKFIPESDHKNGNRQHFLFEAKQELEFLPLTTSSADPNGGWLVVRIDKVFGSERLSLETPQLASLTQAPTIYLHPDDVKALPAGVGEIICCESAKSAWLAQLRFDDKLVRNSVGVFLPADGETPLPRQPTINLRLATNEQKQAFFIALEQRQKETDAIHEARLARLKTQDGTIPIKLVGMGGET